MLQRRSQYDICKLRCIWAGNSRGCHGRHGLHSRRQVGGWRAAEGRAIRRVVSGRDSGCRSLLFNVDDGLSWESEEL